MDFTRAHQLQAAHFVVWTWHMCTWICTVVYLVHFHFNWPVDFGTCSQMVDLWISPTIYGTLNQKKNPWKHIWWSYSTTPHAERTSGTWKIKEVESAQQGSSYETRMVVSFCNSPPIWIKGKYCSRWSQEHCIGVSCDRHWYIRTTKEEFLAM